MKRYGRNQKRAHRLKIALLEESNRDKARDLVLTAHRHKSLMLSLRAVEETLLDIEKALGRNSAYFPIETLKRDYIDRLLRVPF